MNNNIVHYEQLTEATGHDTPGRVETNLAKHGIVFFRGKGGKPWTTIGLIEAAGGLVPSNQDQRQSSNDIL